MTLPALLPALVATLGLAAQSTDHLSTSQAARPTAPRSTADGNSRLPKITIEAERERALRLKVDQFVTSVAIQPWGEALYRWTKPVCPLVAGLPKAQGEFVLARITEAAIDAHAPLAGRTCQPNLFVVGVDDDPKPLINKWWARNRLMYNTRGGIQPIERFIHSRLPIRVWYNTYIGCNDDAAATSTLAYIIMAGVYQAQLSPTGCGDTLGSHIVRMSTGSDIESAIIVVDGRQMKKVNLGQLADYIALVGLADVRLDADSTPAASILDLFGHGTVPQELTRWDRAFLYSLYNTSHRSTLEVPQMEIMMTRRIAR